MRLLILHTWCLRAVLVLPGDQFLRGLTNLIHPRTLDDAENPINPEDWAILWDGPWYNCENENEMIITWYKMWGNSETHGKMKKFYWETPYKTLKPVPSIGPCRAGHHGLLWSLSSLAGPTTLGGLETILWRGHETAIFWNGLPWYAHLIGFRSPAKPWNQGLGA